MNIQQYISTKLKNDMKKRILFVDGSDQRAINAAVRHLEDDLIEPILLIKDESEKSNNNVRTISMKEYEAKNDELIAKYIERRKGKENEEQAIAAIATKPTFAMLMLEMGIVDGVVGGLINTSSDFLRAAFKVIGPKAGVKTISSAMIMTKGNDYSIFSDISVNIEPNVEQLKDIAYNAAEFAVTLGIDPKVAFLSFSTQGSARHEKAINVSEATNLFNENTNYNNKAVGEIQFDAAIDPITRASKYKGETFEGSANIFVFPSLESGNIGYKIAQRMGGYGAIGPIITGINKPVNDLSRGSTEDDVYNTALITANQAS